MLPLLFGLFATAMPQIGGPAPVITLTDIDGKKLVMTELLQRGPLVLAFFPKAFTPG